MVLAAQSWLQDQINRSLHPVYNGYGRHIGYYDTDNELCRGVIHLFTEEKANAGDPSEWRVKRWGIITPITTYCLGQELVPPWASKADQEKAKLATPPPPTTVNLPGGIGVQLPASLNLPANIALPDVGGGLMKWAIVGGVALVAVTLLSREDNRRGYR